MRGVQGLDPIVRLAFEFLVLTAVRSGEVRGARTGRRSTLRLRNLDVILAGNGRRAAVNTGRHSPAPVRRSTTPSHAATRTAARWCSPGLHRGSVTPLWMVSKVPGRVGIDGTLHGMRSSFRDWCGGTGVAREVAEACLAHRLGNAAELAYARSDLLARRRELMEAWGEYVSRSR